VAIHIVDRRLNPGGKSLENRQRFLRRAKALVQGAVKKSSQERDIKDVLEGGGTVLAYEVVGIETLGQEGDRPGNVEVGDLRHGERVILREHWRHRAAANDGRSRERPNGAT